MKQLIFLTDKQETNPDQVRKSACWWFCTIVPLRHSSCSEQLILAVRDICLYRLTSEDRLINWFCLKVNCAVCAFGTKWEFWRIEVKAWAWQRNLAIARFSSSPYFLVHLNKITVTWAQMELNLSSDTYRPSDQHRVSIPVYEIEENEVVDRGNINIIKFCLLLSCILISGLLVCVWK